MICMLLNFLPGLHAHVEVRLVVGEAGAAGPHLAPGQDVLPLFPAMSK